MRGRLKRGQRRDGPSRAAIVPMWYANCGLSERGAVGTLVEHLIFRVSFYLSARRNFGRFNFFLQVVEHLEHLEHLEQYLKFANSFTRVIRGPPE